ncbi:hypothetical protein CFC21_014558 [Triticum aestivum]|uniref:Protein kinase domain-containing protein n=2 Tax=Triticum aestivum TaxID=4565 RepID=A0A9R1IZA9_WHEAT|nr:hypothetical protein CFC21_014558 [Triticum aestivum]
MDFALALLESITNNFSEELKIGSGGYGDSYRAVHNGEEIAVKKLHQFQGLDDKQFHNEIRNLTKISHKNVIRLIGYCHESRSKYLEHNGERVFAKSQERVLCFEYMQGGSLEKYIADETCTLDWPTCYKIIQGACDGLNHLHNGQEKAIFHLDLKPSNILLDKNMTPKIADLGLSRLVDSARSQQTEMRDGTLGYMPPEYIDNGIISNKFDVFSLVSIIIRMMDGNRGAYRYSEMSPHQFIDLVSEKWKERLQTISEGSSYEVDILQVRTCLEIALRCVDTDRRKRPTITDIVRELGEQNAEINTIMSLSRNPKANWLGEMHINMDFTLALIETITNNFSEDHKIGSGGYGDVYKAVHNGKKIAVKKLHRPLQGLDDKQLDSEFRNLSKVRHQNVARLIGYCYESQHKYMEHNEEHVDCILMVRIICFEYVSGGSLDRYIADESCGLDWPTCYDIITGTCEGLNHLHNGHGEPIFHLDLKPSNILLDKGMMPKIADVGLSRLLALTHTHKTEIVEGTMDYMPPEYLSRGLISKKFDVFSLGVIIIKIIAGNMGFPRSSEMSPNQFIALVTENWMKRLQPMSGRSSYEIEILQVRTCVEMALRCVDADRNKRPSIKEIIRELRSETIIALPTDHKSNLFGLASQSRASPAPDQPTDQIGADINTNLTKAEIKKIPSVPPAPAPHQSKGLTEAVTNLIEAEDKAILSTPPDNKFNWSSLDFQPSSMIAPDNSEDLILQGVLQNGEMVAVKKPLQAMQATQKQFENEVNLLMKLKHPNIVRLVGYCYDTQHLRIPHEGKFVFTWNTESLLCLEYVPNGTLENYISDASSGLDWHTRRKIIEGVSYGVQYLHEKSNGVIIHLDLKPANILLDGNMLPKITDFGLSRLYDQTHTIQTKVISGTRGYMPPEYVERGIITPMSDIFSLGVIIMEVVTGHRDYPYDIKKESEDFIELELQKWRNRLQQEPRYTTLEIDCHQIERCIQIGLICVNPERYKRPTMKTIIDMLQGLGSMNYYINNERQCS